MIQKQNYVAPVAECLYVAIEKRFLTDSDEGNGTINDQATVTTPGSGVWDWMDKN